MTDAPAPDAPYMDTQTLDELSGRLSDCLVAALHARAGHNGPAAVSDKTRKELERAGLAIKDETGPFADLREATLALLDACDGSRDAFKLADRKFGVAAQEASMHTHALREADDNRRRAAAWSGRADCGHGT